MKKLTFLYLFLAFSFVANPLFSHGGGDQHKEEQQEEVQQETGAETTTADHHTEKDDHLMITDSNIIEAGMDDFSSLHPLVVHVPIMLLLLALLTQLAAFFLWAKQFNWMTLLLLTGGFLGAYIASTYVHPHTTGLSEAATAVLEQHDLYADYTIWLSGIGLLIKAVSLFLFKDKRWLEIFITIVLLGAAFTVSKASHYGATLAHIHGVGAQGNFIETHGSEAEHSH